MTYKPARTTARFFLAGIALAFMAAFVVACSEPSDDVDEGPGPDQSAIPLPSPDEIDVPGPEAPDTGATGAAADVPSCAATETISWNAAVDNVGNEVTVIGPVYEVSSTDDGLSVVLGSDEVGPGLRLELILTQNALDDIAGDPSEIFADSQICAIGVVQSVLGNLQIVINESEDIQRL